jgi:hypothetical protein
VIDAVVFALRVIGRWEWPTSTTGPLARWARTHAPCTNTIVGFGTAFLPAVVEYLVRSPMRWDALG